MSFFSHFFEKKEVNTQEPKNLKQAIFRDFKDVLYILVCFLFVYALLFRVVVVEGDSMNQTLIDGDRILLMSNVLYRNPKQEDIIVISKDSFRDGECIVKRVIATEGQTIDIDFENRIVYVDGKALEESYVFFREGYDGPMVRNEVSFPLVVEEGCIFVMGDNRNNSTDSRDPDIGLVDYREVLGKALFLILPGTDEGAIPADYSRIGGLY
jgi:signal peptidase I